MGRSSLGIFLPSLLEPVLFAANINLRTRTVSPIPTMILRTLRSPVGSQLNLLNIHCELTKELHAGSPAGLPSPQPDSRPNTALQSCTDSPPYRCSKRSNRQGSRLGTCCPVYEGHSRDPAVRLFKS